MAEIFVGESRRQVVKELLVAFDQVKSGGGSHVAVLVSQPGWGKTRIVQEFYAELAARQPQPAYWPPTIVPEPGTAQDVPSVSSLSEARKAVYPTSVTVSDGARMDWMWWGILCGRRSHLQLDQAMFDDATQLYAHAEALMSDPSDPEGWIAFDVGTAVIGVLGLLGLALAPPIGAAITIAGAAKVGWDNSDLVGRLREWFSADRGLEGGRVVASNSPLHRKDEIARLVEGLGRLTRARPMVVVVDDAHFADETLVDVLDGLLREARGRVFIIATAWPSHLDGSEAALPFAGWGKKLAEDSDRYSRFDLVPLLDGDIAEVVRAELPAAEPFVQYVQELYGSNLLVIRAVLRLPRIRQLAEDGELDGRSLGNLPKDVEAAYAEHWHGLPGDVQHVLALAAQMQGDHFLPEVVAAGCATQGIIQFARERIAEGVSPYAWTREIDESLHTFVDPVLRGIAKDRTDELLIQREIDALYSAIVAAARSIDTVERSPQARQELLAQHVALVETATAPSGTESARSALSLAQTTASRYDYPRAIELARLAIGWSGLPPDHPQTLETRSRLGSWLGAAGRVNEAVREFAELLPDEQRVLGADRLETLATRQSLASWLGEAARLEEARPMFEDLLADRLRIQGPEHTDTLEARHSLASLLGEVGRLDEASREFTELLEIRLRLFGSDDPNTLATRHSLASLLGAAGRLAEATEQFEELLTVRLRVLGRDDPDTLAIRHSLAWLQGAGGEPGEASRHFAALLVERERILGPEHPDTLATRHNLASFLGEAGHEREAAREFQTCLDDRLRILGPDHPDTLATRHNLAAFLGAAGQVEEATRQFEVLLADRLRVMGPDHPRTVATRRELALLPAAQERANSSEKSGRLP